MAQKKAGGSTRNGRDSESKRLGIKRYGGEHVIPGNILCRQRGTQWHPGAGVGMGTDHTIFAVEEGTVEFNTKRNGRIYISVKPARSLPRNNFALREKRGSGRIGDGCAIPFCIFCRRLISLATTVTLISGRHANSPPTPPARCRTATPRASRYWLVTGMSRA